MSILQVCVKSGLQNPDVPRAPRFKCGRTVGLAYLNEPGKPPAIHNIPLLRKSSFVEYVK